MGRIADIASLDAASFHNFLHGLDYETMPENVRDFARRCLLDLIGVLAAGKTTELSSIISNHVCQQFAAGSVSASILLDGRKVSPAGAALANGMTIDAIDAHDGFKPAKGHVGCHVFPALLAFCEAHEKMDGKDFLTSLVVGYEIGCRASMALHESVPDYHTSGAWGAVTAAALGARILRLNEQETREAIGIGEYHGPRSQMMRCIDHPSMLKDGSGWGAMAGVSAAYLAKDGFTGAPAITVEADEVFHHWRDLGEEWLIIEQYFKAYPVCRWAQPTTEAALALMRENNLSASQIDYIEAHTFHEGCRLETREPETTEQAQYSLPFPVAAAIVFGKIGAEEIGKDALGNTEVLRLSRGMKLVENDSYNEAFPEQRYAHVRIRTKDGREMKSDRHGARGDPEAPLTDDEISAKFDAFATPVLGNERASAIKNCIAELGEKQNLDDLMKLLVGPV